MGWFRRLRSTIIGSPMEDRLDEEMRFHVDERTEEFVRRGMTREEARREAARRFGSIALMKDRTRDADTFGWVADVGRDVWRGARGLRKSPSFTVTAIVSLAHWQHRLHVLDPTARSTHLADHRARSCTRAGRNELRWANARRHTKSSRRRVAR